MTERFAAFRELVLADPALQERLRGETEWDSFRDLVAALAAERGCPVTAAELDEARLAARRAWLERRL